MLYDNISGYKFVELTDLYGLQSRLKKTCQGLSLLGTILLSEEGINVMLAGEKEKIAEFEAWMKDDPRFSDVWFKHSLSETRPFDLLKVRIKPEIITMRTKGLGFEGDPLKYISPTQLKRWYDDQKDFIILDTRNEFEIKFGRFKNAISVNLESFSEFPEALSQLSEEDKLKPVVTYCTGGVRCEKAAPYMEKLGFKDVYQLEGGIINYFEHCHEDYWDGECFVFDNRVSVDGQLQETGTKQCQTCFGPVTADEAQCELCAA